MGKRLHVVYDSFCRKFHFENHEEIIEYELIEYENFRGLDRLVSENLQREFIVISDELICRTCWGDFRIEKSTRDILILTKHNKVVLYADGYGQVIPSEIKKKLKEAGIKYLTGIEIS